MWSPTQEAAALLLQHCVVSGIYWFGYEYIKSKRMKARGETKPRFRDAFVAGALSGAVCLKKAKLV